MAARERLHVVAHDLGGNAQGPLLLLLHANGFHGRVFLPMLPVFAPRFRCAALDLPGHGSAPTPSRPFSAEELLAAVRDYVDAQGIQDCYCLGHSLGGSMATLLQLERPQTFRAMFLFEPVIRPHERLEGPGPGGRPEAAASSGLPAVEPAAGAAATGAAAQPTAAAAEASGCGPSPSLLSGPQAPSDSLLARIARKRQAVFPSVEAAKAALGAKPPFNTFTREALDAYLACGGLRPLEPSPDPASRASAATAPASTSSTAEPAPAAAAAATVASESGAVTLSCAPENEARVYEALDPPPWRQWRQLTTVGSAVGSGAEQGCGEKGCGGGGGAVACDGDGGGCARAGDRPVGRWRRCRVAIAVGRDVGLHARLAVWGAQVAQLVPGAELVRFSSLHHLGPMEHPRAVAEAALQFFARDGGLGPGGGGGGGGALSKM